MTKLQFIELIEETFKSMQDLTATKGEEYARSEDQLANFKRNAEQLDLSMQLIWFVYFNKHLDAIISYVRRDRTLSEPIEKRIDDAILYLILLKAMAREES